VIQGVYAHRVLALCGVALIIWALPRLARRCDLDAGLVLWLGAANPLVLFHLVSGIHNEGLMIGLMLAGVELVLRALDRGSGSLRDPRFVLGVVVVSLGAAVKLPALLALGFVGMAAARRRGGLSPHRGAPAWRRRLLGHARVRDVAVVAAVSGAIAAAVFVVLGVGTGLGFGWTRTLGTANVIRSWMSLATDLGQLSGQVGILAGLGDHTDTVLTITRGFGGLLAGLLCLRLLLLVLRGRLDPVTGLGVGLGAVVLLGPVVHPWYLLWAAIPLAATRGMPRHRRAALAASALLAVMLPPTGSDFAFRSFQLPLAILAGIVILAVALLVVRRELRAAGPSVPGNVLDDVGPTVVGGLGGAPLDGPPTPVSTGEPAPLPRPDVAGPPSPTGPRAPT
jgi:alpha-1,6-mannosyltransferase